MTALARAGRGASYGALAVVVGVASALAIIAIGYVSSSVTPATLAAVCVGAPLGAWLLATKRVGTALIVVAAYIALLDGFLRLKTGQTELTVVRDVVFYLVVVGAVVRLAISRGLPDVPPWTGWVLAFVSLVLVQLLNPANPPFQIALLGMRPHLEWVPLFFFGYAVMRSPQRLRAFLVVLLVLATINGIVGFVQFNLDRDQLAGWGPGYTELIQGEGRFEGAGRVYYDDVGAHVRPPALGPDTGFGGRIGFLAIPGALALLIVARGLGVRIGLLLLSGGLALAVITSQQRTVVLASLVVIFAFAGLATLGGRGLRLVLALTVTAAVGYGAVHFIAGSAATDPFTRYSTVSPSQLFSSIKQDRGQSLKAIPNYFSDTPLGVGLGRSGPASGLLGVRGDTATTANSETEFNYLLSELGVPGLVVLLGFSLLVLGASISAIRRLPDRETRMLLAAVAAPLVAILVTWVSTSTSATTPLAPYMWFASGVIAYWWRATRSTTQHLRAAP